MSRSAAVRPEPSEAREPSRSPRDGCRLPQWDNPVKELFGQLQALNINLSQEDEDVTLREKMTYKVEKFLSYSDLSLYYILSAVLVMASVILGLLWHFHGVVEDPIMLENDRRLIANRGDTDSYYVHGIPMSIFIAAQVILAAGFDSNIDTLAGNVVYIAMIVVGLVLFGMLIGMITESFESLIESIRQGELKAVEHNHTLVLGWNEGTVRLICQLAFLRRQFRQMNETWGRTLFWWTRVTASTSVAKEVIIVMCNDRTKEEMERAISQAFAERGISKKRTRLGCDVICRVGDPSDVQALQRVGAQHARAVVVQAGMDVEKSQGMTIRTLMAMRFVLYTSKSQPAWDDLRIVVELNQPSTVVATAAFAGPNNEALVYPQDLSVFLRGLLFSCLGQPGLGQVQMELMSFESAAIKFRKASTLNMAHRSVSEAALLWEDAVFLGVQPAAGARPAAPAAGRSTSGLLQDPGYEIQPDDMVIFLCATSVPRPAKMQATAGVLGCHPCVPVGEGGALRRMSSAEKGELCVLICGWRSSWDQPERLLGVLEDLEHDVRSSMLVHFVCRRDPERFGQCMKVIQEKAGGRVVERQECGTGERAWVFNGRCTITHTHWDDDVFEDLEEVVKRRQYSEAIIIPPPVAENGKEVQRDPWSKDTWLISVMLMLQHLQTKHNQKAMHVIAENALDATAKLAIMPSGVEDGIQRVPDFVNALAIKARALCQVLAYPQMCELLNDLYSKASGTPVMMLVGAKVFHLTGKEATFGQATRQVLALQPNDGLASDVLIGIKPAAGISSKMMPPNQSDSYCFQPGDALIIITRRANTPEKYEELINQRERCAATACQPEQCAGEPSLSAQSFGATDF